MPDWKYDPKLKTLYKRVWHGALTTILGWTSEQVEAWSLKWEDYLNDVRPSLFFHEMPLKYIANVIIPKDLLDSVLNDPKTYHQIVFDWEMAITQQNQFNPEKEGFDWAAAKTRSDLVIARYKRELGVTH